MTVHLNQEKRKKGQQKHAGPLVRSGDLVPGEIPSLWESGESALPPKSPSFHLVPKANKRILITREGSFA